MLKPKIQFQERNTENMNRFLKGMDGLRKAHVTIGFHDDSGSYPEGEPDVVEVALWNEFGTKNMPQRSFIRSAVDENEQRINKWREKALELIVKEGWPVDKALSMIGQNVVTLIQNKIKSNVPPPNADATRDEKRRHASPNWGRTLMDTETMLRAVGFKVVL